MSFVRDAKLGEGLIEQWAELFDLCLLTCGFQVSFFLLNDRFLPIVFVFVNRRRFVISRGLLATILETFDHDEGDELFR